MTDKFLSLLGICRKANLMSRGHDASLEAIACKRAKMCILAKDASQRLKDEIIHAAGYNGKNIKVLQTDYTMSRFHEAIGSKIGVMTINDGGFANRLAELQTKKYGEEKV